YRLSHPPSSGRYRVRDIDEPALLGAYYGSMAMCEGSFGDFERAIGRAQCAVELCQAGGDVQYLTQAPAPWLWSNVHVGDFQSVLVVGANLRRAAEPRSGFRWYAYGLGAMLRFPSCRDGGGCRGAGGGRRPCHRVWGPANRPFERPGMTSRRGSTASHPGVEGRPVEIAGPYRPETARACPIGPDQTNQGGTR